MGKLKDFYRIVPGSKGSFARLPGDSGSGNFADAASSPLYQNFSWYAQVMKSRTSRLERYRLYEQMDRDVDISRALDTIADEMTPDQANNGLPFEIRFTSPEDQEIDETLVITLRYQLRRWLKSHRLEDRLWNICRQTIKYGDLFYQVVVTPEGKEQWRFIDQNSIIGILLDEKSGIPVFYQVKADGKSTNPTSKDNSVFIPAKDIIHYSIVNEASGTYPFGESVLQRIYRTFRQLELLEDSVIIYRVVRAPERRVFYIDVGKMSPIKSKQYLEKIKNEIKQKRIPTSDGGTDINKMDSIYNPQCLALDTKIPLLDGRTLTLGSLISEFQNGKENWIYSINPKTGESVPGPISWAGVTKKNTDVIKLTLDNGETLVCTPDHKIPIQGKGFVEAQDLKVNEDSLFSFETREKSIHPDSKIQYTQIFDSKDKCWKFAHRMVAGYFKNRDSHEETVYELEGDKNTIHHKNYNPKDNDPSNLTFMNNKDHFKYHSDHKREAWDKRPQWRNDEIRKSISESLISYHSKVPLVARRESTLKARDSLKSLHLNNPEIVREWNKRSGDTRSYLLKSDTALRLKFIANIPKIQNVRFTFKMLQELVSSTHCSSKKIETLEILNSNIDFMEEYRSVNKPLDGLTYQISEHFTKNSLEKMLKSFNYNGWKDFQENRSNFNHKIIKIETLEDQIDVGTLTIDQDEKYHDYHTFAIDSGIYVKNSMSEDFYIAQTADGRGSKVETLPGGQSLGELEDLYFFQDKMFRGLRIPASWMTNSRSGEGASVNDGRVGTAYIQELRFMRYIMRLQEMLDQVFDENFKHFLKQEGIMFDPDDFDLSFPPPQNFAIYRENEIAGVLLQTFSQAQDIPYMSKRYAIKKYLNWSDEELQINETMLKQEMGITGPVVKNIVDPITDEPTGETEVVDEIQQIYNSLDESVEPRTFSNKEVSDLIDSINGGDDVTKKIENLSRRIDEANKASGKIRRKVADQSNNINTINQQLR